MVKGIRKEMPDAELVAMSANPELTARKNGIRAIDRMSIISIMKEMKDMDLFISGGGSLFQDVTSRRSILYYLGVVYLAKVIFKKKVMIYSQGIGPVTDPKNRERMAKLFRKLDIINVRDNQSKLELNAMGVTENIRVTTDTVFSLEKPDHMAGAEILANCGVNTRKLTLGVSVRSWKECTPRISARNFLQIRRYLSRLAIPAGSGCHPEQTRAKIPRIAHEWHAGLNPAPQKRTPCAGKRVCAARGSYR